MINLDTYYMLKEALENIKIKNADVRVTIKNGEVNIEPYEKTCIIA
jgi:hypothetical protein